MREKILDYLEDFLIQSNWSDENVPEQARALFTAACLIGNIDADTSMCDRILSNLYWLSALEKFVEYDEFVNFMLKYIV